MKIRTIIVCLILLSTICFSQTGKRSNYKCIYCSITETAKIEKDFNHINEKDLYCFIGGFALNRCNNSAEYSEYANPLLFDILQHNSNAIISLLTKYPELNRQWLHSEIQRPLLDYDIRRLIFVIDSANKKSKIQRQILADLKSIKVDDHGYPR